ncbi:hypothetical protein P9112_006798 [Eukaryota sp. TZLM1-RC]
MPGAPQSTGLSKVFIGISGLIGAGKSTLAKALAECLDLPVYYEPVADNEYLEDFYQDMARYAFPLQVYLLNRRFEQHQQIIWQGKGGVQDRTIYEDSVFAKMLCESGLMNQRDYETYLNLFENMSNFMRKPNIIIFLDVTPEESLERIKKRSRDCESSVSLQYLEALYKAYKDFIDDISKVIPVIRVRWDQFRDVEDVVESIRKEYENIQNIRNVDWDS